MQVELVRKEVEFVSMKESMGNLQKDIEYLNNELETFSKTFKAKHKDTAAREIEISDVYTFQRMDENDEVETFACIFHSLGN